MNNMINNFKLGALALLTITLFPVTLFGYAVGYLSRRHPWMTKEFWKTKLNK